MLKISNSQWVNTVSLIRTVINLYSFWVKLRKEFYSWIPWPGTVTFSKQTRLEWRVSPPSVLVLPSSLRSQRSFCPWSIFLLMKQQPPSPGPNGRKVWGITLPPPTPVAPMRGILHSGGRQKDLSLDLPSSLLSQICCLTWRPLLWPIMTLFFFFLVWSNVLMIIFLNMGVFPSSHQASVLCLSVCDQYWSLRKIDSPWPLCKWGCRVRLSHKPRDRQSSYAEPSPLGACTWEAVWPLGKSFHSLGLNFLISPNEWVFWAPLLSQNSTILVHLYQLLLRPSTLGGEWKQGKSSSFLQVELLW